MARNGRLTLWLMIMLVAVAGSANAFDGNRKGFWLGFGAGFGSISISDQGPDNSLSGFQTSLDIGAGITDQLLILYSGHTSFYSADGLNLVWGTPTVILRYYFTPTVNSFYIFGGPAVAAGIGWDQYDAGAGFGGLGGTVGTGYQFGRHYQVQLGVLLTHSEQTSYNAFHATMNVAWF